MSFKKIVSNRGFGIMQVLISASLLAILAVVGLQLMQGLNKSSSQITKTADANQIEIFLSNSLTKPEVCEKVFTNLINNVTVTNTDSTIESRRIGDLHIGSTTISTNEKYGQIQIKDYRLTNLKKDADISGVAYGNLEIETSFTTDSKTSIDKKLTINNVQFTLDGSDKIISCSTTSLGGDEVCAYFGGAIDPSTNKCKDITLDGTTTNSGTVDGGTFSGIKLSGTISNDGTIKNGTIKSTTIDKATLKSGVTNLATVVSDKQNATFSKLTFTDDNGNSYKLKFKCKSVVTDSGDETVVTDSNHNYEDVEPKVPFGTEDETFSSPTCDTGYTATSGSCDDVTDDYRSDSLYSETASSDCDVTSESYDGTKMTCGVRNQAGSGALTTDGHHHCKFKATINCEKTTTTDATSSTLCYFTL